MRQRGRKHGEHAGIRTALVLALCFLLPFAVLLASFAAYGFAPFGDKSVLIMDMSGQYVEFFCGLKQIVFHGASPFFSWGKVMGSSYVGVFAYYVSSPLSFLTLFCPDASMPVFLLFLTAVKIGLCGLTMGIFLWQHTKRSRRRGGAMRPGTAAGIVLFAACYGLMSYNIVYSMCLMWIDGVIWLPLVCLGVDTLLEKNRAVPLAVCFTVLFVSNYYISYMVGIFSVLYFFYRVLGRPPYTSRTRRHIARAGGKFLLSALTGAALGAWLLLPTYFSLTQGKIGGVAAGAHTGVLFQAQELIPKLFLGNYDSITNIGKPFLYCGAAVFLLAFGFFWNRAFRALERITSACVLLVLLLSMMSVRLDLAWHVFQTPNWFPYRYSFLFSFWLVFLAYRCFTHLRTLPPGFFGAVTCLLVFFPLAVRAGAYRPTDEQLRLTVILTAAYLCLLLLYRFLRTPAREAGLLLRTPHIWKRGAALAVMLLVLLTFSWEMQRHTLGLLDGLDRAHGYELYGNYYTYRVMMQDVLDRIDADREATGETAYAAVGQNFSRSYNEAIGFGYRSVAHYSSAYNRNTNAMYSYFGFAQGYLWNLDFGSTALMDSLLGVRYALNNRSIASWDTEGKIEIGTTVPQTWYPLLGTAEGAGVTEIYRNPYALTAPFVADAGLADFSWQINCFESQNALLDLLCGRSVHCLNKVPDGAVTQKAGKRARASENGYEFTGHGGTVEIQITMPQSGVLYGYFGRNRNSDSVMTVNGASPVTLYRGETNCIQPLGLYEAGETVRLSIQIGGNALYTKDNLFYVLDLDRLAEATDRLRAGMMEIEHMDGSSLRGTVRSDGGLLFTSVPYDRGWQVRVDGRPVRPVAFADALLCVPVEAGEHTVVMEYRAEGSAAGLAISITAAVCCGAAAAFYGIRKRTKRSKRAI